MASAPTLHPPPEPPAGASVHVADGGDASRRQIRGSSAAARGPHAVAGGQLRHPGPDRPLPVQERRSASSPTGCRWSPWARAWRAGPRQGRRALPTDLRRAARSTASSSGRFSWSPGPSWASAWASRWSPSACNGFAGGTTRQRPHRVTVAAHPHLPVAAPGARRRLHGRRSRCSPSRARSSFASTCWRRGCGWWRSRWSSSAASGVAGAGRRLRLAGAVGVGALRRHARADAAGRRHAASPARALGWSSRRARSSASPCR